ncbi:MAG: hypothetical protein IT314_16430 [Anaerolineales bacterium]|nr:hypothetical protein [Anaerolineales bacterium]
MKYLWIPWVVVTAFLLGSCGPAQTSNPSENILPDSQSTPVQETTPNSDQADQESIEYPNAPVEKFVNLVTNDLFRSTGIAPDQIEVVAAQKITWPNSALGCPAPGKVYTQGTVPGYRITIKANGQEYIYHTDLNGGFVLCPGNDETEGLPTGPTAGPNIGVPNN